MGKLNIIEKIAHMLQLQGMKMTNDRMEELKSWSMYDLAWELKLQAMRAGI
jgi:hypothetical protein